MDIVVSEKQIINFLRRRISYEDLLWIVNDVQEMIDEGESVDTAVYDGIRDFIKSKNFILQIGVHLNWGVVFMGNKKTPLLGGDINNLLGN